MPKVNFVKSARKKNPVADVGESYYWWQHAFRPRQFSKTRPKASQLTQSSFLQEFYSMQEELQEMEVNKETDFEALVDDLKTRVEELKDQCQDSLDNMPEHLQETSDSGITLQERIDAMEGLSSDLDSIDINWEDSDQEPQDLLDEIIAAFDNSGI